MIRWHTILASLLLLISESAASFTINLQFDSSLSSTYRQPFYQAASFWESQITGYRINDPSLTGITIQANVTPIDGAYGILGSAGPLTAALFNQVILNGEVLPSNHAMAITGTMDFDTADVDRMIADNTFEDVIIHEMGHVIGFGTVWNLNFYNTLYNPVYNTPGQYTGTYGLAAYQQEYDPSALFVPVELDGGEGTANGHWDEAYGGTFNTGITDTLGRDLRYELMTGWLNSPSYISETTLGQFKDIGYEVIPEPTSVLALTLGSSMVLLTKRLLRL